MLVKVSMPARDVASLVAMLGVRRVGRTGLLLMRVRAMQEWSFDFDGRNVFSGDEGQLNDTQDCGSGDSEPCSARATCTVDDADERR